MPGAADLGAREARQNAKHATIPAFLLGRLEYPLPRMDYT